MIEPIIVLIGEGVSAQSETFPTRDSFLIGLFRTSFYNRFHLESAQIPAKANPQPGQKLCHCVVSFHHRASVMSLVAMSPPSTHDLRRDFDKIFLTHSAIVTMLWLCTD